MFFVKYALKSQHYMLQAHENGEVCASVSLTMKTMKNDVIFS